MIKAPATTLRVSRRLWTSFLRVARTASTRLRSLRDEASEANVEQALGKGEESLDYRLEAMTRGYALLRAGFLDFNPRLGRAETAKGAHSKTDELRGVQWRLVLAVAGFEIFLRGRLGIEKPIYKLVELGLKHVALAAPLPVERRSPAHSGTMLEALLELPEPSKGPGLAKFLGLNAPAEKTFKDWLCGRGDTAGWQAHVSLATALRNATAHGALSATRVHRLGLRPAFERLPAILLEFALATLETPVRELSRTHKTTLQTESPLQD
jgi:hypothetical protein